MEKDIKKTIPFNSLSPISDYEKHKEYCDALEWALLNRKVKDIKNIALTGTYGSGKSSILKTLEERHLESEELHFLKISLATFKEVSKNNGLKDKKEESNPISKLDEDSENEKQKNDTISETNQLRLIELSILQQIFYHEKHDKIPESRFKKIRSLKPKDVKKATWVLLGIIVTFCGFFYFEEFRKLLYLPKPKIWFRYVTQGVFSLGFLVLLFLLLKRIIELSHKLSISKFNFQNLEIKINEDSQKSILNNHLDEILYFFEATQYNVVIIEDLDRFQQTEIFTKLREINLLLNNSKAIDREIVFIYAIRDEMFKDSDRTKFFDFIIPVIPVINYSNSKEQLKDALEAFGYSISPELIKDIAFYVDDMRLLYNIVNEFHLYYQKLKNEKFIDKLFAMILYKNIYPEDFVLLGKNNGKLYNYLAEKKDEWVKKRIIEIQKDVDLNKKEIKKLSLANINSLMHLRSLYVIEYLSHFNDFKNFYINNREVTIKQMLEDDNFEYLIKDEVIRYLNPQSNQRSINLKFKEAQKAVDEFESYQDKKELVDKNISNEQESLKRKIDELKLQEKFLRTAKIKELLIAGDIKPNEPFTRQDQIILLLLRHGYIAEDYLAYISYFYPGSLTESDHWFLMNVKNEVGNEFDNKLNNLKNLIAEINEFDFSKPSVFNYDLVEYLIDSKLFKSKREMLVKQLVNESESSIGFIESFIENGGELEKFIETLCNNWFGIWKKLGDNIFTDDEKRTSYLKLIVDFAKIKDIIKIEKNSNLKDFIENNKNFLSITTNEDKIKEVINELDIEFEELVFDGVSDELKEFIYQNGHYALNHEMLALMLLVKGKLNKNQFNTANYTTIHESGCENLINKIEENIQNYISDVYLDIETNTKEKEDYLLKLLNNETIDFKSRIEIIKGSETKISILDTINGIEVKQEILKNGKLIIDWSNVFDYYASTEEEKIDNVLIAFLNEEKNYKILSNEKLNMPETKEDYSKGFSKNLLTCEGLDIKSYTSLMRSVPFTYPILNITDLSIDKIDVLLSENKLILNRFNFNNLKLKEKNLHIKLIEGKQESLINMIKNLELDDDDCLSILKSTVINTSIKFDFINNINDDFIIKNNKIAHEVGLILPTDKAIEVTYEVLSAIYSTNIPILKKIALLNFSINSLEDFEIEGLIEGLGGKYEDIFKKQHKPSFQYSTHLIDLFDNLKNKGLVLRYEVNMVNNKIKLFANY